VTPGVFYILTILNVNFIHSYHTITIRVSSHYSADSVGLLRGGDLVFASQMGFFFIRLMMLVQGVQRAESYFFHSNGLMLLR